jgi:hypothetical protein
MRPESSLRRHANGGNAPIDVTQPQLIVSRKPTLDWQGAFDPSRVASGRSAQNVADSELGYRPPPQRLHGHQFDTAGLERFTD